MLRNLLVLVAVGALSAGCASSPSGGVQVVDRTNAAAQRQPVTSGQYHVQRGDTLYSIAFRYGWDWKALAAHNSISPPYMIRVGQVIRFGSGSSSRPVVATTPNRDASPADAIWDTDLPPVHLLWFGSTAIREVARRAGCDVTFLDAPGGRKAPARTWQPLLTADGRPSAAVRRVRGLSWRAGNRISRFLNSSLQAPFRVLPQFDPHHAPILGVAFRPQSVAAGASRDAAPDTGRAPE